MIAGKLARILDYFSLPVLLVLAVLMALAPLKPEPHLVEKLRMLGEGTLTKPIDIFDLFWHSLFIILAVAKLARMAWLARRKPGTGD